jgi:hypothetical protein
MKFLLVLPFILLTGCANLLPVKPVWPAIPAELSGTCPDLKQTPIETAKMSQVLDVVVDNYSQYHECQEKSIAWVNWYNKQKKIYEEIK